jgi:3-hydroxymyristoyl/3-hydroxydecanoyl-(acyl carrier protein) dehydratase
MPGALIIKSMAQLSAALASSSLDSTEDKEVYFLSIKSSKFCKIVESGDTMHMFSSFTQRRSNFWKFQAKAAAVAESLFTVMIKNKQ